MNAAKTGFLMLVIFLLLLVVGRIVAGPTGLMVAFVVALGFNGLMYWFSDRIVLAMSGAHEVPEDRAPRLHAMVQRLAAQAGIPKPRVYAIESPSPNAFATGRDPQHAAVAVTDGILRILSEEELAGVIAHELAHVRNRDTLIQTLVASAAGAISFLSHMLYFRSFYGSGRRDRDEGGGNPLAMIAVAVLAPLAAMLIQLWISRTREYSADEAGAKINGDPIPLASALRKLEAATRQVPLDVNPATAHMFIVSPFSGSAFLTIFSTHPPAEDRIARLEHMAARLAARS